jgi:hypothetical protein
MQLLRSSGVSRQAARCGRVPAVLLALPAARRAAPARRAPGLASRVAAPERAAANAADPGMFCYQCEQTLHGTGCTDVAHGVCGKTEDCANLQDLVTFQMKGLATWARQAHAAGIATPEADSFIKAATFATLTNVRGKARVHGVEA